MRLPLPLVALIFALPFGVLLAAPAAAQPAGPVRPEPTVRPLPVPDAPAAGAAGSWSLLYTAPNAPGAGLPQVAAPTPDGGACVVTAESAAPYGFEAYVTRVGPDGRTVWRTAPFDVAALGTTVAAAADAAGCFVASASDAGSDLEVARFAGGVRVWARTLDGSWLRPNVFDGEIASGVSLLADSVGGVFVGALDLSGPEPRAAVVRLSGSGSVRWRLTELDRAGGEEGVPALARHPDGAVVASVGGWAYVRIEADGSAWAGVGMSNGRPADIAVVPTGAAAGVYALTETSEPPASPESPTYRLARFGLDGQPAWSGLGPTGGERRAPQHLAVSESGAFVLYTRGTRSSPSSFIAAHGLGGARRWTQLLSDSGPSFVPIGLVALGTGVVAAGSSAYVPGAMAVAYNGAGAGMWGRAASGGAAALIPCAPGVCLFEQDSTDAAALVALDVAGAVRWAPVWRGAPAPSYEVAAVASAPDGALYVGGTSRGTGGADLFVVRIEASGATAWARAIDGGDTGDSMIERGLVVDSTGDVLVAGEWGGEDFREAGPLAARLRPDGSTAWVSAPTVGLQVDFSSGALAPDGSGGAYIMGFDFGLNAGLGAHEAAAGDGPSEQVPEENVGYVRRLVLYHFDAGGDLAWTTRAEALPNRELDFNGGAVVAVPGGAVVAVRELGSGVSPFDGVLAVKIGADGALRWTSRAETCTPVSFSCEWLPAASADAEGNVYVAAGAAVGGARRSRVVRFDPSGAVAGATDLGAPPPYADPPLPLVLGPPGTLTLAAITPEGFPATARLTTGGAAAWVSSEPAVPLLTASDLAVDIEGHAFLAGPTSGEPSRLAVVRLDPQGRREWSGRLPDPDDLDLDDARVAVGPDGSPYLVGAARGLVPAPWGAPTRRYALFAVSRFDRSALPTADEPLPVAGSVPLLGAPRPNPARSAATLDLTLAERADVRVAVYDALGRRVTTLPERRLEAGPHALGLDLGGLSAGVYVVRAEAAYAGRTDAASARLVVVE